MSTEKEHNVVRDIMETWEKMKVLILQAAHEHDLAINKAFQLKRLITNEMKWMDRFISQMKTYVIPEGVMDGEEVEAK